MTKLKQAIARQISGSIRGVWTMQLFHQAHKGELPDASSLCALGIGNGATVLVRVQRASQIRIGVKGPKGNHLLTMSSSATVGQLKCIYERKCSVAYPRGHELLVEYKGRHLSDEMSFPCAGIRDAASVSIRVARRRERRSRRQRRPGLHLLIDPRSGSAPTNVAAGSEQYMSSSARRTTHSSSHPPAQRRILARRRGPHDGSASAMNWTAQNSSSTSSLRSVPSHPRGAAGRHNRAQGGATWCTRDTQGQSARSNQRRVSALRRAAHRRAELVESRSESKLSESLSRMSIDDGCHD